MRPTRRYWTTVGMAVTLAVGAVVFARPLLLVGSAVIGAWLVARQYLFVRAVTRLVGGHDTDTDGGLTVEQSLTPEYVGTDETARVTLSAALPTDSGLPLRVDATPPAGAVVPTESQRSVSLSPDDGEGTTTFPVRVPVAGTYAFEEPSVTVQGAAGLFRETVARGQGPTLTVEPRTPRNVHVGQGGDELAAAFGQHRAGRHGTGLEPAELREYVAGDAANRIDWKATARLDHPYVREYEAELDRLTALLVDHRASMAEGPPGETKLAYAREVALTVLWTARELNDPIGLYTVGDGGLTGRESPTAGPDQYATLRRDLLDLSPTDAGDPSDGRREVRTPAAAGAAADRLGNDDSAYGSTLRPFFADAATYVERIGSEPLFGTVRTILSRLQGSLWTVVLTDDSNRAELRETVKVARRGDDYVLVFLTPGVLFEPGGLADLETAYDRYRGFEQFRRSLASLDRISAYEVGPGDRIAAILEANRAAERGGPGDGTGRSGTGREGTGRSGTGREGTGRSGTGREGPRLRSPGDIRRGVDPS